MNKPHLLDPNESVMSAHVEAYSDHHHPKIHLTPPAYWMNDPNGLIFWDGYYHVFYQHNPFEAKWGYMHWGHAKSKDLITWDHEPIALAPSNEKKELHCFSGCCVDNNGVPTIVYSSIASLPKVLLGSDQWIATGDDKLQKWVKSTANPVLKPGIHGRKIILHLRDPYIWRQEDHWLMVLGGQQLFPKQGFVGIYSSQDLIHWTYLGPLIPKNSLPKSNFSSIWECPIFFPLKWGSSQKWVLIISPMDKVRYCIGDFDGKTFIPGEWHILDGGRCFYAPNVMQVPKGRKILWGWLKGGGIGKWNGCFTIPRELSLSNDENLRLIQKPVKEIEQLRRKQLISNTFEIRSGCPVVFHEIDLTQFAAVEIEFDVSPNSPLKRSFCMKLSGIPNSPMKIQPILELSEDGLLHCGNEIIDIPKPLLATDKIYVQIFLDRAFCEVFFNNDICISAHQLWFQKNQPISIEYSTENSLIHISNHNVWELNPLTQNFPSF